MILSAVKRFSRFVLNDEKAFALELQSLWKDKQEEKPKHNQSELKRCQKRYDELSTLIRGLYENLISGLLPERQYKQLMKQYDDEQAELEAKMETMKKELSEEKDSTMDIQHFISLIRKYKNPTEVSDLMFTELIDKIVVYEAEGVGKAKTQKVDIYFNYVGQVDIAYTEEELAEIKEHAIDFDVTPHQLRHTYITNLLYAGIDPKTVQYLAGHENSKTTMDIYAQVKYNKPEELLSVVNAAFAPSVGV